MTPKDPQKEREYHQQWYLKNKERILAAQKIQHDADPARRREQCREYSKRWRDTHPNGQRDADRRWKENNPEQYKAKMYASNHSWTAKNPERMMWHRAKKRAQAANVPFSIALGDIVIPKTCPVLGIPLFQSSKGRSDNSPSLDRRNPQWGYVPGNIAVISFRANRIKNDSTVQELEKLLRWMKQEEV
jgi:hypothetical protein